MILSALCGTGSLILLVRDARSRGADSRDRRRGSIVVGWGVAQWPYILPETLKVEDAAAPSGTLDAILVAAIGAVLIVLPGFILLYVLDQKSLLPEEGVD